MDAATRARISNVQRNATHQFMGELDDANNVGDPLGQVGAALAGMVGLHERAPQPGDVFDGSTYDNDPRADWSFDPVRLGANLVGTAAGMPGLGFLGGVASDAMGNPGSINLGEDVFGGEPSQAAAVADVEDAGPASFGPSFPGAGGNGGPPVTATPEPTQQPEEPDIKGDFVKLFGLADGGRPVEGPGDGRDDLIDAKLSDGEFVVPADVVSALGRGSTKAGAQMLSAFTQQIRKGHVDHMKKLPAPKA